MSKLAPEDVPHGAGYWAGKWKVHRHTARDLLRYLHRHYGSRVVWKVSVRGGPSSGLPSLVASESSLQLLKVERAGRNLVFVMKAPPTSGVQHPRNSPEDEAVTQDQFAKALGEVWRTLGKHGISKA